LGKNRCTLEIALTYFYEISSTPSPSLLQYFSMNSNNKDDQKILMSYSTNYSSFLRFSYSTLDVLDLFPSIELATKNDPKKDAENLAIFLSLLGPLLPRHYSIASSPDTKSSLLGVVYKVVHYTTKIGHQEKLGLCSNFLKSKKSGDEIAISIVKTKFRLPETAETPIIMVGAGSGISPYFAFLEQRLYNEKKGEKLGKAILIHGCHSEPDFALKKKVDDGVVQGVLSSVWPAYSRQEGLKSTHIQDIIEQEGATLWDMLEVQQAVIYVCGDIGVGVSLREALREVAKIHGNMTAFRANTWVERLATADRLRHDEWGVSTNSGASVLRAARLRLWRKSIIAAFAFVRSRKLKNSITFE